MGEILPNKAYNLILGEKMTTDLTYKFIDRLKALPFVEAIYLYGSRAKDNHPPRSDIDLAILCPSATSDDWLEVMEIIEEADTLIEIDCVRLDKLNGTYPLKKNILKQNKVLYQRGK